MTIADLTPALRASVEVELARQRARAAIQFAIADALRGFADDMAADADEHLHAGGVAQASVDELERRLEELSP